VENPEINGITADDDWPLISYKKKSCLYTGKKRGYPHACTRDKRRRISDQFLKTIPILYSMKKARHKKRKKRMIIIKARSSLIAD